MFSPWKPFGNFGSMENAEKRHIPSSVDYIYSTAFDEAYKETYYTEGQKIAGPLPETTHNGGRGWSKRPDKVSSKANGWFRIPIGIEIRVNDITRKAGLEDRLI
jgi:hypothetical protein